MLLQRINKSNIKKKRLFVFIDAPEIETKGKWVHTGVGVESRLSCIVHAHPHANVTWFKDQKRILPKKNSIELKGNKTRYVLDILHTQLEDLANYTCVAENKLGRTEKTISLTGNFLVFSFRIK